MPLKHRINIQLIRPRNRQIRIPCFIWPVQAECSGVGDEEFVKGDFGVDLNHFVAHARPGEVVYPGGVRSEELGGARGDPVGEAVVGFLCGVDLPAHY